MRHVLVAALTIAAIGLTGGPARAGIVHSYGEYVISSAGVRQSWHPDTAGTLRSGLLTSGDPLGISFDTDRVSLAYKPGSDFGNHVNDSRVSGSVRPVANRLFSLYADTYAKSGSIYYIEGTFAGMSLGFRDIITYNGPGPAPASLRLTFHVDGVMAVSGDRYTRYASAHFGYGFGSFDGLGLWFPGIGLPPGHYDGADYHAGPPSPSFGAVVNASFTKEIGYNQALGGYAFSLNVYNFVETTNLYTRDAWATSDFSQTVSLTGVANGNGSAIDPGQLTFASGMQFGPAAVPEPASLSLLAASGLGLVGYARRRATRRPA